MINETKKWYIIQVLSGFEKLVVKTLNEFININNMQSLFGKIIIPKEKVIELQNGQRKTSERKFFPGYILIQMVMNDNSWHIVQSVPRVMKFVGGTSKNPSSISDEEIDLIIDRLQKTINKPKPKITFAPGELIYINSGPFSDFKGMVEEIDYSKNRLKVSVSIFGRSTPVELNFSQVDKSD
ncbi:MAG: transcription termination/antitermination protein NusG [Enterobacterales bacterium]